MRLLVSPGLLVTPGFLVSPRFLARDKKYQFHTCMHLTRLDQIKTKIFIALNQPLFILFDEQIWPVVQKNQIIILAGDTGCGKTTQIPQLILDREITNQNYGTKIVCTQPRRIAAISVANRVAEERNERCNSNRTFSVGYHVKMDVNPPRNYSSVLYCTPGVILQWLKNDQYLSQVSYLILDEVHERNLETDFLMAICKIILPKRPDLKLILMSATMNTQAFSNYFDNAPIIEVPGRIGQILRIFLTFSHFFHRRVTLETIVRACN